MTNQNFKLTAAIEKADYQEDGSTPYVQGILSGPELDLQMDIVTKSGLDSMVEAINNGIVNKNGEHMYVPLRSGHGREWDYEMGWITKAWLEEVGENSYLWIEAELDVLSSKAMEMHARLRRDPETMKPRSELGFSIGGIVTKARRLYDTTVNKTVRYIDAVELFEASVTSRPAYPTAFVEAIMKSVDWDNIEETTDMTKKIEDNLETPVATEESLEKSEETPQVVEESTQEVAKADEVVAEVAAEATAEVAKADEAEVAETVEKTEPVDYSGEFEAIQKSIAENDEKVVAISEAISTLQKSIEALAVVTATVTRIEEIEKAVTEVLATVTEIANAEVDKSLAMTRREPRDIQEYLSELPADQRLSKSVEAAIVARQARISE